METTLEPPSYELKAPLGTDRKDLTQICPKTCAFFRLLNMTEYNIILTVVKSDI